MQFIFFLICISIILPSSTVATENNVSTNYSLPSCPRCEDFCEHLDLSKKNSVQVFKASAENDTIFCISRWGLGWNLSANGVRTFALLTENTLLKTEGAKMVATKRLSFGWNPLYCRKTLLRPQSMFKKVNEHINHPH